MPAKARTVLGDLRNDMEARRRADGQLAAEMRRAKEGSAKDGASSAGLDELEEQQEDVAK